VLRTVEARYIKEQLKKVVRAVLHHDSLGRTVLERLLPGKTEGNQRKCEDR